MKFISHIDILFSFLSAFPVIYYTIFIIGLHLHRVHEGMAIIAICKDISKAETILGQVIRDSLCIYDISNEFLRERKRIKLDKTNVQGSFAEPHLVSKTLNVICKECMAIPVGT